MFLRIGHRGAAGYEPENTLRSFRRAIEMGVDMIELDVHATRDGKIVVIHDDTVDRTTKGSGKIGEMMLAELEELDAGSGEKIPTLDEVLDLAAGKVPVDIEIKGERISPLVAAILKRRLENGARPDDFVVSSFSRDELIGIAGEMNLRKILLTRGAPSRAIAPAIDLGAWGIGVRSESASDGDIKKIHENGLKIFVWTVHESDEAAAIRRLRDRGVDGVFSNFPDRL